MAKLTIRAETTSFSHFLHYKNHKVSIFNTFSRPQRFNILPQNHILKLRVSCSITERQKEEAAEKEKIVNGLKVNGELAKNGRLISTSSYDANGDKEVGFEWSWPPWKNLPQRYKLIGTTSLAFVICNMDKVGIGEGVSPSAATDLIARTIPLEERSRAVSFVFGGLSFGSVTGLLLAPPLIQNYGWESVFYLFGFLGVAWFSGFQLVKEDRPWSFTEPMSWPPSFSRNKSLRSSLGELGTSIKDVPWKAFFRSTAVWAMIYTHFCGSWGHYTCLSWLPTYFSEELNLNLTEAAWVSVGPPLASILVTSIASQFADSLISKGVDTSLVRKICQSIAFLSPATCMILSSLDFGLPPWEVVTILTGGLALSSFALSGLYCTHQDISPEYASILLGITNTVGAVPGIVGVALTGYLLDTTHSWSISLFAPSIFFYLTGTIVWIAFASSKPQSFSEED